MLAALSTALSPSCRVTAYVALLGLLAKPARPCPHFTGTLIAGLQPLLHRSDQPAILGAQVRPRSGGHQCQMFSASEIRRASGHAGRQPSSTRFSASRTCSRASQRSSPDISSSSYPVSSWRIEATRRAQCPRIERSPGCAQAHPAAAAGGGAAGARLRARCRATREQAGDLRCHPRAVLSFNAPALKTVGRREASRGFESLALP